MCEHHFKCIDLIVLQIPTKQLQISLKELEIYLQFFYRYL